MHRTGLSFSAGCAAELLLLGIALVAGAAFGIPVFGAMRWNVLDISIGVLAIVPPLLLFLWSLRSSNRRLQEHREVVDGLVRQVFGGWSVLRLAIISALAGLCEEALFRGVLQSGLAKGLGEYPALLVVGLVFGVLHRITWVYALLASIIGLYLGLLWIWTGNLLVPVLAHALYDFLALLWFLRRR